MPALNKPLVKALAILVLLAVLGGLGVVAWYTQQYRPTPASQAAQKDNVDNARQLSSLGGCKQVLERMESLLKQRNLQPSTEADARLLTGQCQVTAKEYSAAITQLEKAKALYQELNDKRHILQADVMLQQAKAEIANKTSATPAPRAAPPPSTAPAPGNPKTNNGTYDGVKTL